MTTRTLTPAIAALAADIAAVVRPGVPALGVARDVAAAVGRALPAPGLLAPEHAVGRDECYTQHILHVDPEGAFSIVALVWMPGQFTAIHDHVTWCVVGVYRGCEEESLYRLVGDEDTGYLVRSGHSVNAEGSTTFFAPPGDIHEVRNSSNEKVISIHVYGTDVSIRGTSVRRKYDLPIR